MKRQCDDASQVVQIQRRALRALVRPEGEELANNLAMDHHAGHQQQQHAHAGDAQQPVADIAPAQMQAVVERKEEPGGSPAAMVR